MLPPGRRRPSPLSSSLTFTLLALLLLLTPPASAASAVLGLDLGTEYIKAALVKPGIPLEIVLTKDSKRRETAAIGFKPPSSSSSSPSSDNETHWPERLYGGDALALAPRFPADVYANLKPLFGIEYTADVAFPARNPAWAIAPLEGRRSAGFRSTALGPEQPPFAVEELLAMQLKNVRGNAEAMAGAGFEIRNAVITVPGYYAADERRAVQLAAELAGLNVLALVSDGVAVGLNYATSREFGSGKPEVHLVLDMGAGSTTATVLRFRGRVVPDVGRFNKTVQEVGAMGTGWDRTLGGDALNVLIRDDMVENFVKSKGATKAGLEEESVRANGRTMAKLWREAERLRQVLSANTEASASFEGLQEDVDFRYKLSRADFEEMAEGFAARIDGPVEQALRAANITMEELNSVILHGGLARTPFIQKRLETIVSDAAKIRSNVNADEAAVFGALYKGAGLSPSFRVKEIRDTDAAGYAAGIHWMSEGKDRRQKLFLPNSPMGAAKQVSFRNLADFSFELYQQLQEGARGVDLIEREVTEVTTTNLTASVAELVDKHGCQRSNITTKFSVRIDPLSGIPEVTQGSVSCEVEPGKTGFVDGVKGFFGFGGEKGDQKPLAEDEEPPEPVEMSSATPTSSATETGSPIPGSSPNATTKAAPAKKTVSINVSFVDEPRGLPMPSAAELAMMKKRLASFDASDANRKLREEVFNQLEGLTYRVRDLLEDESLIAVSSKAQRSELQSQLSATSEWLYGPGSTASLSALRTKLSDLRGLVDPIQKRREEASQRPASIQALQESLKSTGKLVDMIKEQMSAASSASASAASEAASSATVPASSTTTIDDFADLDDETATSTSTTFTPPTPSAFFSAYSNEDIAEISSIYDATNSWLTEKLGEQEKLSAHEDPVLSSKQLADRTKKLNDAMSSLLMRKINMPPRSSKPKFTKAKTKTKKSKSKASTTLAAAETSAAADAASGVPIADVADGDGGIVDEEFTANDERLRDAAERQEQEEKKKIHDEL